MILDKILCHTRTNKDRTVRRRRSGPRRLYRAARQLLEPAALKGNTGKKGAKIQILASTMAVHALLSLVVLDGILFIQVF